MGKNSCSWKKSVCVCCVCVSVRQSPKLSRLIGGSAGKDKFCWVPATLDDLVFMLSHDDTFKWLCQVALQVREDNFVIITTREEVVCLVGEAQRANVRRVRVKGLNDTTATDVVQHTGWVFVTGDEQFTGRVDAYGGYCSSCKTNFSFKNSISSKKAHIPGLVRDMVGQVTKLMQLLLLRSQNRIVRSCEPETNIAPPQVYSDSTGPECPERLRKVVAVSQSVMLTLQSPAPPDSSRLDPFVRSSMKQTSLTVPSCTGSSTSFGWKLWDSWSKVSNLIVLSLEPVASRLPILFQARLLTKIP